MTHAPAATAAAVAAALFAAAAVAQDETVEAPDTYTTAEDGSATHKATGVTCPVSAGDLILMQVLSYDRGDEHLGLTCEYVSQIGSLATVSVLRTNVPELVGNGTEAQRWNATLYATMANYPGALPAQVDGLEGDPSIGLRGALMSASGPRGVPLQLGMWRVETGGWTVQTESVFLPTSGGWAGASLFRQLVIDSKTSIESN